MTYISEATTPLPVNNYEQQEAWEAKRTYTALSSLQNSQRSAQQDLWMWRIWSSHSSSSFSISCGLELVGNTENRCWASLWLEVQILWVLLFSSCRPLIWRGTVVEQMPAVGKQWEMQLMECVCALESCWHRLSRHSSRRHRQDLQDCLLQLSGAGQRRHELKLHCRPAGSFWRPPSIQLSTTCLKWLKSP